MFTRNATLTSAMGVALVVLCFSSARADVQLPAVFSNNMVLQRDIPIPVWGWAEPGEKVEVTLGKQTKAVTTSGSGIFRTKFDSIKVGKPLTMTVKGNNTLKVTGILIGEVWICSGQSNMAMTVARSKNAEKEIAAAKFPQIRMMNVARATSEAPAADCTGSWAVCSPQTVGSFSAAAYFFGRKLHKELGVPIGLINTSWGGTPIEAWTSHSAQGAVPAIAPLLKKWERTIASFDPDKSAKQYVTRLARWQAARKKAKDVGRKAPRRPRKPVNPRSSQHRPAMLYNGMIAPLAPYAIRGAIWYQGEHNAGREFSHLYQTQLPTMIGDWRKRWRQGDFQFLFVQLPNFRTLQTQPVEPSGWVTVREAMRKTLAVANTGMAITTDIGEARDIHPKNKQDVGKRLALWALGTTYKIDILYSGPINRSNEIANGRMKITFSHTGRGLKTADGGEVKGFAIAGKDRKFVYAEAKVDGDTVVVWSKDVKVPVAVRYAWADNPVCNLVNSAGLPASPFRTDVWAAKNKK